MVYAETTNKTIERIFPDNIVIGAKYKATHIHNRALDNTFLPNIL